MLNYNCLDVTISAKRPVKDDRSGEPLSKCLEGRDIESMVKAKKFRESIKDGEMIGVPAFSLEHVSKKVVNKIMDIEDINLQVKVLLFIKDVLEKGEDPFTKEKFTMFTISDRLFKEILVYIETGEIKLIMPNRRLEFNQHQINILYNALCINTNEVDNVNVFYHIVGNDVWTYFKRPY